LGCHIVYKTIIPTAIIPLKELLARCHLIKIEAFCGPDYKGLWHASVKMGAKAQINACGTLPL